jgi:hypothetical protein
VKTRTNFLPGLSTKLYGRKRRSQLEALRALRDRVLAASLSDYGALFGEILPVEALEAAARDGRRRLFPEVVVFWAWVSQILEGNSSCAKAVTLVQRWYAAAALAVPSFCTSAFCRARQRLSDGLLAAVESRLTLFGEARIEEHHRWRGYRVKLVDGTSVQLSDTAANQAEYPQPSAQKPGCGFPVMGVVALLDVALGTVEDCITGPSQGHDLEGLHRLVDRIRAKDLLVADRAFCSWEMLALLSEKGAGCVMRLHQMREAKLDWRRGRKLDENSRLVEWTKPIKPGKSGITREGWERLPGTMKVRLVRLNAPGRDGKPRTIYLATTLLDERAYPTEEIAGLYAQRWSIEVRFRDLKSTMGLERLRVRTPQMAHKTLRMAVITYNLVKLLQLEASRGEAILADEIGFKGTLDVLVEFRSGFIGLANRPRLLERKREEVLDRIRERLVLPRPGRSEPRAVKTRPKPYPYLTTLRGEYVEIQHRSRYRKAA